MMQAFRVCVSLAVTLLMVSCAPGPTGVTAQHAAKEDAILEVLELEPKPGATVTRETVLRARLRFTIMNSTGRPHTLFAAFRMTDPRGMFDGSFPEGDYPKLEGNSGTVEFSFPLRYVFDEPELARPIQLKFMLIERGTVNDRVPIADTQYFEYVHP